MTFTNLPHPIASLLRSLRERDRAAVSCVFAADSVVCEGAQRCEGTAAIGQWIDGLPLGEHDLMHPINVAVRDGNMIVTFVVHRHREAADRTRPDRFDWCLTVREDHVAALSIQETAVPELPAAVADFVRATNAFDLDALVDTFAEDALVNDQFTTYVGKKSVREWADGAMIGDRVTMHVVDVVRHYECCIVGANVDGEFDKAGLPDPFALTFYFSLFEDRIVRLIVLRTCP